MRKCILLSCLFVRLAFAQECASCWFDAEYLLWFVKNSPIPTPLVTNGSYDDAIPGAIGQPHTRIVLGKQSVGMGWMQGFRVDAGGEICRGIGMEGGYFLLPTVSKSKSLRTSGNPGSPNYAIPIFDASGVFGLHGVQGETIFILPGPFDDEPGFSATYTLQLKTQLQGAELNAFYRAVNQCGFQLSYSGGICWLSLHEKLLFKVDSLAALGSSFGSAFYNSTDRFKTANHFLAAQGKIDARCQIKKWYLEAILKGALGAVLQKANIKGFSQTSDGNVFFLTQGTGNITLPGGVFAEPSNIGVHKKSPFAWGFETKARTGFEMTKNIEVFLGYTFLWISNVLRPGDQIDRKINSTRSALAGASRATVGIGPGPISFGSPPGPAPAPSGPVRPKVLLKTAPFWAQGLDAGVLIQF